MSELNKSFEIENLQLNNVVYEKEIDIDKYINNIGLMLNIWKIIANLIFLKKINLKKI